MRNIVIFNGEKETVIEGGKELEEISAEKCFPFCARIVKFNFVCFPAPVSKLLEIQIFFFRVIFHFSARQKVSWPKFFGGIFAIVTYAESFLRFLQWYCFLKIPPFGVFQFMNFVLIIDSFNTT